MKTHSAPGQPEANGESLGLETGPARWVPPVAIEWWFALGVMLLGTVAWGALALAGVGAFSRGALIAVVLPGAVIGTWVVARSRASRDDIDRRRRVSPCHVIVLGACLVATFAAAGRPGEYLVAGVDASVYLNIASLIERRGGLTVSDPTLDLLDDRARETFFSRDPQWPHLLNYFPGGLQVSDDGKRLQPNFFHLLPAAMAGLAALTGVPGAGVFVMPIAGGLTLLGVWLLALRLASPIAASVAALWLTFSYAQLWFLGYSSSETITAALVVGGLALLVRSSQDASRSAGAFGGAAMGLAACARIDVLVLVSLPVVVYFSNVAWRRRWTSATTWAAALFFVTTTHAVLHAVFVSAPYTQRILLRVVGTEWVLTPVSILLAVAAAVSGIASWRAMCVWPALRLSPLMRVVLAIGLLGLFVRSWPELVSGAGALLFTPVGLALMAFGVVWLVLDRPEPEVVLVAAIFVLSAVAFIGAPLAGRLSPTVWRRLVPIVIPLGGLFVGYAISRLWGLRAWWRVAAPVLAAALLLVSFANTRMLFGGTPMKGVRDQLARVVAGVPSGTVLLTDDSLPSHMALSLHATMGQPVLSVRRTPDTAVELERLARTLASTGRGLRLAVSPVGESLGLHRSDFAGFELRPVGTETVTWIEVLRVRGAVPTQFRTVESPIQFYDLAPRLPISLPQAIDIGAADFAWRGTGFHGPERMDGAMVRWTADEAIVELPRLQTTGPARLVLRLAAPRPAGGPPVPLTVSLGGQPLRVSALQVFPDLRDVSIELDAAAISQLASGPAQLTLRSEAFVPREVGLGDDVRRLGVVVDWIRIEPR